MGKSVPRTNSTRSIYPSGWILSHYLRKGIGMGRAGIRGKYVCITLVRCGSFKKYYSWKEEAVQVARGLQYNLMKEGNTGRVQVLASRFNRKVSHHWTKVDIIDFLNGEYGWSIIYEVNIKRGKLMKFVDRVYQNPNSAQLTEFFTEVINPSKPQITGLEIIQNDENLKELCRRAPSPTAFRLALRRLGILKKPLSAGVANYAWKVIHET
jgi:hypothetical protein